VIAMTGLGDRHHPEYAIDITGIRKCFDNPSLLEFMHEFYLEIINVFMPKVIFINDKLKHGETTPQSGGDKQDTEIFNSKGEKNPWDLIPDKLWDRQALEMWIKGYSCPEIARHVPAGSKRVTNRLSELRRMYETDIVPLDEQRKKYLIKRIT